MSVRKTASNQFGGGHAWSRDRILWGCVIGLASFTVVVQSRLAFSSQATPPATVWVTEAAELLAERSIAASDLSAGAPDRWVSDLLVEAIIQVESTGNPRLVGQAGERGLMQIKRGTWNEMTEHLYGRRLPFDMAFDSEVNVQVGRAYLAELQRMLGPHRASWKADERALLLAAYNSGPTSVIQAKFDLRRVPAQTANYVSRVEALHDLYLSQRGIESGRYAQAVRAPSS
jgi:soluble lytic murein transglycosylase-like protein